MTYVFTIDGINGETVYRGIPNRDLFTSHRTAIRVVSKLFQSKCIHVASGLIGLTYANANLLIITTITSQKIKAVIDFEHNLFVIKSIHHYPIPLRGETDISSSLSDFPVENYHYFCETMDLTHPYPSKFKINEYDPSFCWNKKWRSPFEALGVPNCCVVLVQGSAKSKYTKKETDNNIVYLTRRCVLNPGTRFYARGLNDKIAPGNEVECDLIVIRNGSIMSHTWRRGSVPILWKTKLGALSGAQHIVGTNSIIETDLYFKNIRNRLGYIPVTIMSLLNDEESDLGIAYRKTIQAINTDGKYQFVEFDVNSFVQKIGENLVLNELKMYLHEIAKESGFTEIDKEGNTICSQKTLFRFNCADSLDRTNLATFSFARALLTICGQLDDDVEFLAKAFVKSGDVLSMLYTNTPAIRSSPIRALVPGMGKPKSDTKISIIRFFNNYFTDKDRQSIIDSWVSDTELNHRPHSIDSMHLYTFPSIKQFIDRKSILPSQLFMDFSHFSQYSFETGSNEVCIRLFQPTVITSIRFMIAPPIIKSPVFFSLSCGMDQSSRHYWMKNILLPQVLEPQWARFFFPNAKKWNNLAPYDIHASYPSQFVWIEFDTEGSLIGVSNIKLEGLISAKPIPSISMIESVGLFPNSIDDSSYRMRIKNVLSKDRPILSSLLDLEIERITSKISISQRNHICIEYGLNPALTEPRYYLRKQEKKICSFCLNNAESGSFYFYHSNFLSMLDPEPCQSHPETYLLCMKCSNEISIRKEIITKLANSYQNEDTVRTKRINRACIKDFGDNEHQVHISPPSFACFVEYPESNNQDIDCILDPENQNPWEIQSVPNNDYYFNLCLPTYCEIYSIRVVFNEQFPKHIHISSYNQSEYVSEEIIIDSLDVFRTLSNHQNSHSIILTMRTHDNQSKLSIQNILVYGTYLEEAFLSNSWYEFPAFSFRFLSAYLKDDTAHRTCIYHFKESLNIRKVLFGIPKDTQQYPTSLIIAFYLNEKFIDSQSVLIPSMKKKTQIGYYIRTRPLCNKVKVFYLDRSADIVFLETNFSL